jgi:hypothetical protein
MPRRARRPAVNRQSILATHLTAKGFESRLAKLAGRHEKTRLWPNRLTVSDRSLQYGGHVTEQGSV